MKIDKELAEELDKFEGREWELLKGAVRVEAKIAKHPRAVLSLRMSNEELTAIERGAASTGKNVSEFLRESALRRAEEQSQWQLVTSLTLTRLLAELRSIEDSLQGMKDVLDPAFQAATGIGPERVAKGFRAEVEAKLDGLAALRESLDELWQQTA